MVALRRAKDDVEIAIEVKIKCPCAGVGGVQNRGRELRFGCDIAKVLCLDLAVDFEAAQALAIIKSVLKS